MLDLLAEPDSEPAEVLVVRYGAGEEGFALADELIPLEWNASPVHEVVLERVAVLRVVLEVHGVLVD